MQNRMFSITTPFPPPVSMQHKNDHLLKLLFMIQLFVHVNGHHYERLDNICAFIITAAQKLKSNDNWASVSLSL